MNRKLAALEMLMKCNLGELGEIKIWITELLDGDEEEQVDCFECGATWKHDCQC